MSPLSKDIVLRNARQEIAKCLAGVMPKGRTTDIFARDVIGMVLEHVASSIGTKYADDLIDEFDLQAHGWEKHTEQR